jgi:OmpA-OmpF porin, OOP family
VKLTITLLATLALLICSTPAAFAVGNQADSFTISAPVVGGYTFDGDQHQQTRPVYGIRGGYNFTRNFGFEALFDYVLSAGTVPNVGDLHVYRYGGDLLWNFMPDNRLVPYLAAGYGALTTDYEFGALLGGRVHNHDTRGAADYGAGLKFFLNKNWALRGDVRQIIVPGKETFLNYEYTAGLTYQFSRNKVVSYLKSVPESEEALEAEPEPEPVQPSVAQSAAKPAEAAVAQQAPGAAAVPGTQPEAGAAVVPPGAQPEAGAAVVPPGAQPEAGAAVVPGAQPQVGVVPVPGVSHEAGAPPANEAPLEPLPAAEPAPGSSKYCVTLHIAFDIGSTRIPPEYYSEIAIVGNFMKQFPTTTIVVEGHTDNVGNFEANKRISRQRAEAVVDYLAQTFGIERSRLSAVGYGSTRPIADNKTIEGKEKNRRIEAVVDCPIGVKALMSSILPQRLCESLQIEFDTGKADIKPEYQGEIAKISDFMKKYPTTTAVIEGHTDNVGGYSYNMKLSQLRAESVVNFMVNTFGIERTRLSAKGYGYTRRVSYNNTPEGRQKNRRINAIIDCVIKK